MQTKKPKLPQYNFVNENNVFKFLLIFGAMVLFTMNILIPHGQQHFVQLAQAFIQGKLYFLSTAKHLNDSVMFQGQFYWPLGPLPAIILIPFVIIWGDKIQQGYIQFFAIALVFFLLFKIAKKITGDQEKSLWLSFGYIFSTAFVGIALRPWSWQFGQIIANVFIIYALYEYLHKRSWLFIGICIGLAMGARFHLLIATMFFALSILFTPTTKKKKLINLFKLIFPIITSLIMLLIYNYLRFHNFFEQGYSFQHLDNPLLLINRQHGLWSLAHVPVNIYYFLIKSPEGIFIPNTQVLQFPYIKASPWGLSILFTSPMFLWLIKAQWKNKDVLFAALTTCLLAFVIFGYYGIGWRQYGYRYAVDFYPFLFLILAFAVRQGRSLLFKIIIIFSYFFNLYLVFHY